MELSMKDIGKKINKMVQVKKVGPMVPRMKEIINKVKKVGKVNLNGLMEVLTMVNLKIII
jgi:methyl coenzyme M reductase beta subunit